MLSKLTTENITSFKTLTLVPFIATHLQVWAGSENDKGGDGHFVFVYLLCICFVFVVYLFCIGCVFVF